MSRIDQMNKGKERYFWLEGIAHVMARGYKILQWVGGRRDSLELHDCQVRLGGGKSIIKVLASPAGRMGSITSMQGDVGSTSEGSVE